MAEAQLRYECSRDPRDKGYADALRWLTDVLLPEAFAALADGGADDSRRAVRPPQRNKRTRPAVG